MSISTASAKGLKSKTLSPRAVPAAWVRNPSWPSLPSVTGLQKLVGLYQVTPDASFVSLSAAGAYTVNWGDGSASENIASGVQAYHEYSFADPDLDNTNAPVTLTDSGDVVGRTAHGYTDGMIVKFYNIVSTTGITPDTPYYVISAAADTFQVSATLGGSAIALTTDGSATLLDYKIAIITVVGNGANITNFNISKKHNKTNLQNAYTNGWLDVAIEGANLTTLNITDTSGSMTTNMEQFSLTGTTSITNAALMFQMCRMLQSIPSLNLGNLTTVNGMFNWCHRLRAVPLFNTASVTDFTNMFGSCFNLVEVPNFVSSSGTTFTNMFNGCSSLVKAPYLNTASANGANGLSGMFNGCASLTTIPLYSTSTVVNFSSMFVNCYSLKTIPLINTGAGTNFSSMFSGCNSLESIPLINTASGTNFSSMFNACYTLTTIPELTTSSGTNFGNMFYGCKALTSIPLINTGAGVTTAFSQMFYGCTALSTIPLLNTALGVDFSSMFNGCFSLRTIPLLNTGSGTNFSSMFAGCYGLETVPLLNTAAGTNMSSMFSYIANYGFSLKYLPALNMSSSTNNGSFWYNAPSCYRVAATGIKATISFSSAKLSQTALEEIFTNLGVGTSQTITISNNIGAVTPVSISNCNANSGTAVITMTSTAGINIGDQVTGTGTNTTTGITVSMSTNTFSNGNSGFFADGDMVAFASVPAGCANVALNTTYYVVNYNSGTNAAQISATVGGTAITFSGAGANAVLKAGQIVTAITPSTSVTVGKKFYNSLASQTLSFRPLKTYIALSKAWTVTG